MKMLLVVFGFFVGTSAFGRQSGSFQISACQLNEGYELGMKDAVRFYDAYVKECVERGFHTKDECQEKYDPTATIARYKGYQEKATAVYKEKNLQDLQITINFELDNFGHQTNFSSQVSNGLTTESYAVTSWAGGGGVYNPPKTGYNIWEGPEWSGWFVSFDLGNDYEINIDHYRYYPELFQPNRVVVYAKVGDNHQQAILTCRITGIIKPRQSVQSLL
ncbi:MAG: hypothetical protein AB7G93_22085 [Bdellovibrionales bacterium]